jgi:hypothetical protein
MRYTYKIHSSPEASFACVGEAVRIRELKVTVVHKGSHLWAADSVAVLVDPFPRLHTSFGVVGIQAVVREYSERIVELWETKGTLVKRGRHFETRLKLVFQLSMFITCSAYDIELDGDHIQN